MITDKFFERKLEPRFYRSLMWRLSISGPSIVMQRLLTV